MRVINGAIEESGGFNDGSAGFTTYSMDYNTHTKTFTAGWYWIQATGGNTDTVNIKNGATTIGTMTNDTSQQENSFLAYCDEISGVTASSFYCRTMKLD